MPTRILDIHPHVISTDEKKYPRDPLGGKQSVWSQERPTSYEQLLAAMDEAGVAKAAIVHSSTCYGFDNSYCADAVAAHPDRFTGVCSVDMLAPDAAEKIRHWVGRGMTGLRLFTAGSTMQGQGDWLSDPRSFAGWECAAELNLPVCVQARIQGIPQLNVLIERFPTVRIVIDHLLSPNLEEGSPYAGAEPLFALAKHDNIYLKLSSVIIRQARAGDATPESFFPRVVQAFGAKRIAWGSNFPASPGSLKAILSDNMQAIEWLPDEDKEWIFNRTASQLYPALA
ncbi:amidohydrolase family protein [Paraburkholderia sp.]|uniref:amidohydrolase family protein n=1 Tax=Paraburkholderia sp. TaxID=1926495 RepID=UPI003D6F2E41